MSLPRSGVLLASAGIAAVCAAPANTNTQMSAAAPAEAITATSAAGQQTVDLAGTPLQIFTYRPVGCSLSGALVVFHGLERNAVAYRDFAIPLGIRFCMLVLAPLFDEARFPTWRYQRGGIVHDGAVQPQGNWTVQLVARLVSWIRGQEGQADLPYALIGHSAGGQFLSRVAAFAPDVTARAAQIVIANPSSWVRPALNVAAPYGFAGVYDPVQGAMAVRRYLAAKITVLLGQEDVGSRNLATNEEAAEQGGTRFERGQNVFREAELATRQHGWVFNWRLAVVPGVGHNAARMFTSDQMLAALRP
jgi:poly(3-hydroxybutyrate) depolymerase